jgi:hypothetical protein
MTANRCWIALVDEAPADATAAAAVTESDGSRAGVLAAWIRTSKPVRHALRADPRIVDPHGDAAWISLVLAPPGFALPFDDLAVQQVRRDVLAGPPSRLVSTLLRDSSHFQGAITATSQPVRDDPFARLFPARVLHAEPGLLATTVPPVGPTIERYGSANPWPWDRFV